MSQSETKLVTPMSLLVDLVLMVVFFLFMYGVLSPHVPSTDHRMIVLWGLITTACMTALFWLALQMFRVVFRGQREAAKNKH